MPIEDGSLDYQSWILLMVFYYVLDQSSRVVGVVQT